MPTTPWFSDVLAKRPARSSNSSEPSGARSSGMAARRGVRLSAGPTAWRIASGSLSNTSRTNAWRKPCDGTALARRASAWIADCFTGTVRPRSGGDDARLGQRDDDLPAEALLAQLRDDRLADVPGQEERGRRRSLERGRLLDDGDVRP